jgi:hypothetical protein
MDYRRCVVGLTARDYRPRVEEPEAYERTLRRFLADGDAA